MPTRKTPARGEDRETGNRTATPNPSRGQPRGQTFLPPRFLRPLPALVGHDVGFRTLLQEAEHRSVVRGHERGAEQFAGLSARLARRRSQEVCR